MNIFERIASVMAAVIAVLWFAGICVALAQL